MKIEFSGIRPLKLEENRIVNVRIVNKNGNIAQIEINGTRTEARIEADTPDEFLAVLTKEDSQNIVQLRILSSTPKQNSTRSFKTSEELAEILVGLSLPLSEEHLQTAFLLHTNGIRITAQTLRMIQTGVAKFGQDIIPFLLMVLQRGYQLDVETLDLIKNYKKWSCVFSGFPEIELESTDDLSKLLTQKNTEGNSPLDLFFQCLMDSNYYRSFLINYKKEKFLIEQKKESKDNPERFYFNLSGDKIGDVFLIVDRIQNGYNLKLFLQPDLLMLTGNKELVKNLEKKISQLVGNKIVSLTVYQWIGPAPFLMEGQNLSNREKPDRNFKLDISV